MGIKVSHTPLEAVLALGAAAGKSRQATAQIERNERVASQIRGIQASKEMAEFNAELDVQKLKQVQVIQMQAEARAQQWDIEKATLASQADFARQERQRNEALDQYEATEKYLDEHADDFDEPQLQQARFDNFSRLQGRGTRGTFLKEKESTEKKSVFDLLGDTTTGLPTASDPAGLNIPESGKTQVTAESAEQLALVRDKQFKVISPDGDQEIIDAAEWPAKKEQGYLLAEIMNLRKQRQDEKTSAAVRRYTGIRF